MDERVSNFVTIVISRHFYTFQRLTKATKVRDSYFACFLAKKKSHIRAGPTHSTSVHIGCPSSRESVTNYFVSLCFVFLPRLSITLSCGITSNRLQRRRRKARLRPCFTAEKSKTIRTRRTARITTLYTPLHATGANNHLDFIFANCRQTLRESRQPVQLES